MTFYVQGVTMTPEGERRVRRVGEYWTHDEAVAAAKLLIDTFLFHEYRQGVGHDISREKLLDLYRRTGEAAFVIRDKESSTSVSAFNHLEYAAERCAELFATKPKAGQGGFMKGGAFVGFVALALFGGAKVFSKGK